VGSPGDATDEEGVYSASLDSNQSKQKTLGVGARVITKPVNAAKEAAMQEVENAKMRLKLGKV
jgi:hypothetical protein